MSRFVARRGAEGRTGSGDPGASCPSARCPGAVAGCASDPPLTERPAELKPPADGPGGASCSSIAPACSFPLPSAVQKNPFAQLVLRGGELSSPFSWTRQWVLGVACTGLLKAFEMSRVCRCGAVYCFKFNICAMPSILRGNKTYREQS